MVVYSFFFIILQEWTDEKIVCRYIFGRQINGKGGKVKTICVRAEKFNTASRV